MGPRERRPKSAFRAQGAEYTGLAIGNNGSGNFLYAANASGNTIDVLDHSFTPTMLTASFVDPTLPAGFTAYNVQQIGGSLFVTYENETSGGGVVNEFDLDGNFLRTVASNVSGGPLESPWGLALAPSSFGQFEASCSWETSRMVISVRLIRQRAAGAAPPRDSPAAGRRGSRGRSRRAREPRRSAGCARLHLLPGVAGRRRGRALPRRLRRWAAPSLRGARAAGPAAAPRALRLEHGGLRPARRRVGRRELADRAGGFSRPAPARGRGAARARLLHPRHRGALRRHLRSAAQQPDRAGARRTGA